MPRFLSLFSARLRERERKGVPEERDKGKVRRDGMASIFKGGRRVTFKGYRVLALRANTPRVRITLRRPGIV